MKPEQVEVPAVSQDVRADMVRAQDEPVSDEPERFEFGAITIACPHGTKLRKAKLVSEAFRKALVEVGARGTWAAVTTVERVSPQNRGKAPKR